MNKPILLRRDQPLEPGRKLRFTFTIAYEVPLDEDNMPDGPATFAEIEDWLSGGGDDTYGLWRSLHENYDRTVVEHYALLDDVDDGPRFERAWEQRVREGTTDLDDLGLLKASREWLDEIPVPSSSRASL